MRGYSQPNDPDLPQQWAMYRLGLFTDSVPINGQRDSGAWNRCACTGKAPEQACACKCIQSVAANYPPHLPAVSNKPPCRVCVVLAGMQGATWHAPHAGPVAASMQLQSADSCQSSHWAAIKRACVRWHELSEMR